ncbi:MAG: hypothetical protein ACKVHE_28490 [Planctomycetales bacterium]|jgi:hypothetical protein
MFHRLSILITLASWSFAWFAASVHVHHSGHDCHHDVSESVPHSHSGSTHSHCHSHGKTAQKNSEQSESTPENSSGNLPAVSGDCPLCDLTALELAAPQAAEVAPAGTLIAEAALPHAAAPDNAARYALRGRAPPTC